MDTAEKVIDLAISDAYLNRQPGLSLARRIAVALRAEGLLREGQPCCLTCSGPLAVTGTCPSCGAISQVACPACERRMTT